MKWQDEIMDIPELMLMAQPSDFEPKDFGGEVLEFTEEEIKDSLIGALENKGFSKASIIGKISPDEPGVRLVVRVKEDVETKPSIEPPKESIWPMDSLNE